MQVRNLSYQHDKHAPYFFQNLSFDLEPGKIHALHGKNGMGKTVLMNLLGGKMPPQSIITGDIVGHQKTVLVNQRFDQMIADQFSFEENLRFACMNKFPSLFSRLKEPRFVPDFIDRFHIDKAKPAGKLSGGQRQILALLMILQQQMTFLLLDEPTATLDEENARMVFDFLQTLQNVTLLVVCHDTELINEYTTGRHLHLIMDSQGVRRIDLVRY
jgi:ABC-type multidrug transport system ATPase subunit